jgi:hypothetical protein
MEFAFIFGNQYNESGAVQQMPGKKGEQPRAPTKSVGRHIGVVAVLSPARAGRHTIAHGNAVGTGTHGKTFATKVRGVVMSGGLYIGLSSIYLQRGEA